MDQLKDFADDRLVVGCIYCGGSSETREHTPSKVFLDAPFPENLPIVFSCRSCNNGFSLDEEYLACLIEAVISGSSDPESIKRPNIRGILNRTPALRAKLEAAKTAAAGQVSFAIESERVERIIVKLARGHAAFELSQPCRDAPASIWWGPLILMDDQRRQDFESVHVITGYPEIGSRSMQRMLVAQFTLQPRTGPAIFRSVIYSDWLEVQEGRYRYHAIDYGDSIAVKIVIGDYLACKVEWDRH